MMGVIAQAIRDFFRHAGCDEDDYVQADAKRSGNRANPSTHRIAHEKLARAEALLARLELLIQLTENIRQDVIMKKKQRDDAIDKPSP